MRFLRLLGIAVLLALTASAANAAEPPTVAEELAALRKELAALREENARLRAELAAAAGSTDRIAALEARLEALAAKVDENSERSRSNEEELASLEKSGAEAPHVSVYGVLTGYDRTDETSVFDAEAFELVLSGRAHPRLGFFAEIEYERAAAVGGERGGEVVLEQAYATYTISPLANFRAGVLLVPFGNANLDHYAPLRDVITKPLVSYVVAPSDWTDNGISVNGMAVVTGAWSTHWEVDLVSGLGSEITSLGARAARQPFGQDNNGNKAVVGRFAVDRGGDLEVGLSGYRGKYDDESKLLLDGWAVDAGFHVGRFRFAGEYDHLRGERTTGPDADLSGHFERVVVDIGGEWLRAGWHGQSFPAARVDLVGQYDVASIEGPWEEGWEKNTEERWTLGLNYRPTRHFVLKVHREWSSSTGRPLWTGDRSGWLGSVGFMF